LSHLTAALDRPNITLFGPTDPGLIGGYGRNQHQRVSPTKRMGDITADEISSFLQGSQGLSDRDI
ncbi:MAG: lipopolysaccharide heptosyltransferase 1, partial [Enterobacterales bacterium]|nr:lipopolysaccharide heptosyltransferase 1 [Enterobacterales bacterium]